ncbi:hypothetical protein TRVL_07034 [Trypanosoma vivax]|uniref:Uncharacterized protein n=1 Tax=Trypanosoma vivax (strain Y486) TaxID=1055687 RepID=G0UAG0_TRYVY|nr:hypothetical protein TRVL_07034 [Trypanosoma vivax]CCC52793.1 hypothetical protein TVY486_1102780 [Trypanosoma vivax Y486]
MCFDFSFPLVVRWSCHHGLRRSDARWTAIKCFNEFGILRSAILGGVTTHMTSPYPLRTFVRRSCGAWCNFFLSSNPSLCFFPPFSTSAPAIKTDPLTWTRANTALAAPAVLLPLDSFPSLWVTSTLPALLDRLLLCVCPWMLLPARWAWLCAVPTRAGPPCSALRAVAVPSPAIWRPLH